MNFSTNAADLAMSADEEFNRGLRKSLIDGAAAVEIWTPLARQGLGHASYYLAVWFGKGLGIPQDISEAVKWLRLSVVQGFDLEPRFLAAIDELERLLTDASHGDIDAQTKLGVMYFDGVEMGWVSYSEAARWWRTAAEKGGARAQTYLGFLYAEGKGVPRDARKAASWWMRAAAQGSAIAKFNLGVLMAGSDGRPRNMEDAMKWYRLAAQEGLTNAWVQVATIKLLGLSLAQKFIPPEVTN